MNPDNQFNRPFREKYTRGSAHDIQMHYVESSAIQAAGYIEEDGVFAVQFTSHRFDGKTYLFRFVPKEVWEAFMEAPSKGQFFQEHIRGNIGHPADGGYEWTSASEYPPSR